MRGQRNMSDKQLFILEPSYLKKFSCIGSSCEDTCCAIWNIGIDKATYKKYQKVSDKELKLTLKKSIKRNKSDTTDMNYARIQLDSNKRCPMLSNDQLCQIQSRLGEDFLSPVCASFPRVTNKIRDSFEMSGTVSCPEVARIALLNPEPMEFDYREGPSYNQIVINNMLDTNDLKQGLKEVGNHFWELKVFTIKILQNRAYSLVERLIILGLFFERIQKEINDNSKFLIPELINHFEHAISRGYYSELVQKIPTKISVQMKLLLGLVDIYSNGIKTERYKECLEEFIQGINGEGDLEKEELNYKDAYSGYYAPFMKDHEYILENYLVNYVFQNLFPFGAQENVFGNYASMVLHYSLIKIHLIGIANFHKGLTIDIVIKLIQSFEKEIGHNKIYMKNIINMLEKSNYISNAYMAILIKN
jgi:lysine-N-methylase